LSLILNEKYKLKVRFEIFTAVPTRATWRNIPEDDILHRLKLFENRGCGEYLYPGMMT
jgi:hypothetical protein